VPFRVVPDLSEAPENCVQSSRTKGCDVFDDRVLRLDFFNEAVEVKPESRPGPSKPCAFSCGAKVLAGEPSANNVNCSDITSFQFANIVKNRRARPVLAKNLLRGLVNLTKRYGFKPASAF
jgi:hypothetical protein